MQRTNMSAKIYKSDMAERAISSNRSIGNGRHSPTSPLKLFGQARKKINDIFVEIANYVGESHKFMDSIKTEELLSNKEAFDQVSKYVSKVKGIQEILLRDRMKVVFFGRTSNGKSTVINAMLRQKILPSGIGHTTHCFVQVEGVEGPDAYLLQGGSDTVLPIQDLSQLASALSSAKLDANSLIRICWPKDKLGLLRDDVILVDSPGIDVSPDLDSWIDDYCLDADVFVFVANAESTLMQTEKNFFHKVSTRLSKPNIFILENRWDASAYEPETMEEVKLQHIERIESFLCDELGVIKKDEVDNRVFFVSAREALIERASQDKGHITPVDTFLEGHQLRLFEFKNFERKFEECISQSAVQTKFAQHTQNGKYITSDLAVIWEKVFNCSVNLKMRLNQDRKEALDKLDYTDKQLHLLTTQIKEKINQMAEEVDRKVAVAIVDEIKRLAITVDEFDRPFHPDSTLLHVYRKELHYHVEECLRRNLAVRCTPFAKQILETTNHELKVQLMALLPEELKQATINVLPVRDFEIAYRIDCRNLCADFREDIGFKFSLGITSLMQRFLGKKGTHQVLMHHAGFETRIPRSLDPTPLTPSNNALSNNTTNENDVVLMLIGTFTSLYSRTTVGALAVSGLIAKAAGWKVIIICGGLYGGLYLYERLTWTRKAQERCFKRQYVDYAASKLRLIVDMTSSNCSHQVQQELQTTLATVSQQVDRTKIDLKEDIHRLQKEVKKLEDISQRVTYLRNKASYLDSELNMFIKQFLRQDSHL